MRPKFALTRPPYLLKLFYRKFIWRFSKAEKIIYLTFDDGPEPEITPWVLSLLSQYNAKATFFLVGKNVRSFPSIVDNIVQDGHAVGNHTYNHFNGWKTSEADYLLDIKKCESLVKSKLFRPPYGKITKKQAAGLKEKFHIIMWDVLCKDYDQGLSCEACIEIGLRNIRNGSVVVLHDSKKAEKNLKAALPVFLKHFSSKGYQFKAITNDLF